MDLNEVALAASLSIHHHTLCILSPPEQHIPTILVSEKDAAQIISIRPIAVGHTLYLLVTRCTSSRVLPRMGTLQSLLQFGCGAQRECKAAVPAACLYIHNMTPGHVLLKLNFKNVFNCLRCDKMLMAVQESTLELFDPVRRVCEI